MINVALPKGRLGEKVYAMFEAAGYECPSIKENNRKLERVTAICLMITYAAAYAVYTAVAGLSLADNLWNSLPVIGALFGTIGTLFASKSVNLYRAWKYGDSVCWLSFNINIGLGAIGGIICEILTLISLTVGIFRFKENKTNE